MFSRPTRLRKISTHRGCLLYCGDHDRADCLEHRGCRVFGGRKLPRAPFGYGDKTSRHAGIAGGGFLITGRRYGLHGWLTRRFGRRGDALYNFVACLIALGVSGFVAYLFARPLLFPSLGPTAILFFESPMAVRSSPRNTLIGHGVAILAGALSLAVFGLLEDPSVLVEGITAARAGAGAFSVALTGAILIFLRAPHPPAGSTVLIVSLGLMKTPAELSMIAAGVMLATVARWTINRAAGVPTPLWSGQE